jgi:hypothetical protein
MSSKIQFGLPLLVSGKAANTNRSISPKSSSIVSEYREGSSPTSSIRSADPTLLKRAPVRLKSKPNPSPSILSASVSNSVMRPRPSIAKVSPEEENCTRIGRDVLFQVWRSSRPALSSDEVMFLLSAQRENWGRLPPAGFSKTKRQGRGRSEGHQKDT